MIFQADGLRFTENAMHSEIRNQTLFLSGDITVKTVTPPLFRQFEQQCRLKDTAALDLSGVSRADSACVSLLLAALRQNSGIRLQNLPESVTKLADLYEIDEWVKP